MTTQVTNQNKNETTSNKQTMTTNNQKTSKMNKRQELKNERLNLEAFILGAVSALMGCEPEENTELREKLDWAIVRLCEVEQEIESE